MGNRDRRRWVFGIAVGAIALATALMLGLLRPPSTPNLLRVALAAPMVWFLARINVPLRRDRNANATAAISLRFVLTLFLIGTFRNWDCVWIFIAASTAELQSRQGDRDKRLFNIAFAGISTLTSLAAATLAESLELPRTAKVIVDTLAIAFVYHLANVSLVAAAIATFTENSFAKTFRFLYETAPGYLAAAAVVAASRVVLDIAGNAWVLLPVAALATPMAFVILREQNFRRERDEEHAQRLDEKETHIAELELGRAELERRQAEIEAMYASTVEAFALAIDAKDRYTQEHIQRVKLVAVAIAAEMGLAGDDLRAIEVGAALHDIGKIAIPEHILNKPGRLTQDEFEMIKRHAEMGARILQPVHFPYPVMGVVRSHHEKWDGSGYPDALAGENIPLGGRILAVADVYDALTSDRPYREGWPHDRAAQYLEAEAGIHFDPTVVQAFLTVVERDPALRAGTPVRTAAEAQLANDISQASFEYLAVLETSRLFDEVADLGTTCDSVAQCLKALHKATTCLVILSEGGELAVRSVAGANAGHFLGARVDRDNGPTAETFASAKGRHGHYDSGDLLLNASTDAWRSLKSFAFAPIRSESGAVIGSINLYSDVEGRFGHEDVRILEALGVLIASGIENARDNAREGESTHIDLLTGLHDERHLARLLAKPSRSRTVASLVVFDFSDLRDINRKYGYETGNAILRGVESALGNLVHDNRTLVRLEGDTFALHLPSTELPAARQVAEAVREALSQPEPLRFAAGKAVAIELSVGVHAAIPREIEPEEWIAKAEANRIADREHRTRKVA
ncbi:MAG: HD domain-containing phosphohydrolase [Armatimonadota bacterium]